MPHGIFNYEDMIQPMGLSPQWDSSSTGQNAGFYSAQSGFGFGDDMRVAPLPIPLTNTSIFVDPARVGGCPAGYSKGEPNTGDNPYVLGNQGNNPYTDLGTGGGYPVAPPNRMPPLIGDGYTYFIAPR